MKNLLNPVLPVLVSFTLLSLIAAPAQADENRVEYTDFIGIIIFEGEINGVEGNFLLDTGADFSIVDAQFAEEQELEEVKSLTGLLTSGLVKKYKVGDVGVGEWYFKDREFSSIDLSVIERYLGMDLMALLGGDVLKEYVLTIDYQNDEFILSDTAPVPASNATVVPFRLIANLVYLKGRTDPAGEEYSYLVDTGASSTVYFEDYLEICCPEYTSEWPSSLGWLEVTFLGNKIVDAYLMPYFSVGNSGIESMVTVAMNDPLIQFGLNLTSGTKLHGIIGWTYMKYFRVTFDYPNEVMILEPYEHYKEKWPDLFNDVGIMIAFENDGVVVEHILPDCPARDTNISVNDRIVAIDGVEISNLNGLEIAKMTMGKPGTPVTFLLERNGKQFNVMLVRENLFRDPLER